MYRDVSHLFTASLPESHCPHSDDAHGYIFQSIGNITRPHFIVRTCALWNISEGARFPNRKQNAASEVILFSIHDRNKAPSDKFKVSTMKWHLVNNHSLLRKSIHPWCCGARVQPRWLMSDSWAFCSLFMTELRLPQTNSREHESAQSFSAQEEYSPVMLRCEGAVPVIDVRFLGWEHDLWLYFNVR